MAVRKLIPYAGFDPDERHTREFRPIDARRAAALRASGMSWPDVAMTLTDEAGRSTVYTPDAVCRAVRRLGMGRRAQ